MLFVHTSLGHLGSDKCHAEIEGTFHFRCLGRKLRKFIAACDLCQQTKHMNRAYDVAERHHLPERSGELLLMLLKRMLCFKITAVRLDHLYGRKN